MQILVVRNDKLGDFITALPTLYVLKNYNATNYISVLVAPLNRKLAEACPFIDQVIVDEGEGVFQLALKLRQYRFDASITLFSNTRVAIAQFLGGIPLRIAPATKIAQIFFNRRIKQHRSQVKMAEFEYNLELAKSLFEDISLEFPKPLLNFDSSVFERFCTDYRVNRPVIAFHPGFGGSSDANWTLEEYIELLRLAEQFEKFDIVMTFGPDEEQLFQRAKQMLGETRAILYRSQGSVVDFAALISSFKLFISTSTGTYHLASASGCETFTFFADTLFASSARWKSIGELSKQHHYMIPLDPQGRSKMFDKVKRELRNRLEAGF